MLKKVRNHFVSGLVVLGPIFLTLVFIGYLVRLTDNFVVNPVFRILPMEIDAASKVILTKVAIAVVVFVFVSFVGLAAEKFIFRQLFSMLERAFANVPIFNKVYNSIKEVTLALFGEKKGHLGRVVYVEYPRKGSYAIAFVSHEGPWDATRKVGKDLVTVYVPSPPNPATGFFIFVPPEEIIESDLSTEEGIRLVISGGAAVPK
jgi:uncharacterized membrane protein